jgi:hypothetical protein
MTTLAWIPLGLSVQLFVGICWASSVGKGRVLSRPLWRFRPFRYGVYRGWDGGIRASGVRMLQIWALIAVYVPACFFLGAAITVPTYWLLIIALYMDDYVTGDDERWKRFKQWARNKLRWRMVLSEQAEA